MKRFDLDWGLFVSIAQAWNRLTLATRIKLVALEPRTKIAREDLGRDLDALLKSGFLVTVETSDALRVSDACQPIHNALRAMHRHPLPPRAGTEAFLAYAAEYLTSEERVSLVGEHYWGSRAQERLYALTSSRALAEFRTTPGDEYEEAREPFVPFRIGNAQSSRTKHFDARHTRDDLLRLLDHAEAHPGPFQIADLVGAGSPLGRASKNRLAAALHAGLRYLLLFATLDGDLLPVVTLWPALAARLQRPPARSPRPTEVTETCDVAWAADDLARLLVQASAGLRVKVDGSGFYAKDARELEGQLADLPTWLDPDRFNSVALGRRIDRAFAQAFDLELVQYGGSGKSLSLEPTEKAWTWLDASPRARLRPMLDRVREELRPSAPPEFAQFDPAHVQVRGLETLKPGHAYSFDAFLEYQARNANPLHDVRGHRREPYFRDDLHEAQIEHLWAHEWSALLMEILLPLGAVRVGRTKDGSLTIELTAVGRYIAGFEDDFELEEHGAGDATPLRVGPDFVVTFLAPSPRAEASVARFAERNPAGGSGVGHLFRLTRTSILQASQSGLTTDDILTALQQASPDPVPDNVAHEIRTWSSLARSLALEPTDLLRCQDPETAARVLAAASKKVERLTDTILALRPSARRADVARLCRREGVFIALPEAEKKPRKKRRRSRY